ncbi:hypothetical protein R50072_32580 [Simiduia litorea]|uniref:hypothetical protein n=1 Tax=Simiduia litorea TaxID=1435348 RepID=UPI0036F43A4E
MTIDHITIITKTSSAPYASSSMKVGAIVYVGGEPVATTETIAASGVSQKNLSLRNQLNPSDITLDGIEFYIEAGGDPTDAWLPGAVYVYASNADGALLSFICGISAWPEELWMSRDPADPIHAAPPAIANYNLGTVYRLSQSK